MEIQCPSKRRRSEKEEPPQSPSPSSSSSSRIRIWANPRLGFFHLRLLFRSGHGDGDELLFLRSDRVYTLGRDRRRCDIVLGGRRVSRRHCRVLLDGSDRKLRLFDGCDRSGSRQARVSSNGVFVNGRRLRGGVAAELEVGDEVLLGSRRGCRVMCGFLVEKVAFFDPYDSSFSKMNFVSELGLDDPVSRAKSLLSQLRGILKSSDPVSYLMSPLHLFHGKRGASILGSQTPQSNLKCSNPKTVGLNEPNQNPLVNNVDGKHNFSPSIEIEQNVHQAPPIEGAGEPNQNLIANSDVGNQSLHQIVQIEHSIRQAHPIDTAVEPNHSLIATNEATNQSSRQIVEIEQKAHQNEDLGVGCSSDGKTFFLNRLKSVNTGAPDQCAGVTLPQLLYPIEGLLRVFIATFTCDVSWFLSCCKIPNHLPVTIACHSGTRCWSASSESRTSTPYFSHPNLLLVYPQFPEVIAFGKDRKKQGVACHHPKLIVLQREDSIRVVVTSANLVSKQWNHVTNTVWWQDFPRRTSPNYSTLFGTTEESETDFAAQLAGFIASLITDVPNQAHWIEVLTKYDFGGARGHLVASVPGVHAKSPPYLETNYCLSAKQILHSKSVSSLYLGSVQASVVGLSHRFRASTDSTDAQVKTLFSVLGKCRENTNGTIEVLLKRNMNIPVDANAVSVLVADLDDFSEEGSIQLGFLPREVAKWVSPLSDIGFFNFSALINPKEALAAAFGGTNPRVQLILYVSKGPNFSDISKLIQEEHFASLCSLLASLKRCLGLWRLQEVLSRYKWPESLETDFLYGSSSVGTSISPQFLSTFSAAAGKKSFPYPDSDESDPEWGCWTVNHEIRNPSIKLLFPTIERVKTGACGIQLSRYLLSLSEKTWQRLRTTGIFHDAIPYPCDRVGYPMHVKVARRRFKSKLGTHSFGWTYCGSHNFSPAAWGQSVFPSSESNAIGAAANTAAAEPKLHICNYELGIILIAHPSDKSKETGGKMLDLDDITLPFVIPAPKYQNGDRPATPQAMREAWAKIAVLQREASLAVSLEEMNEDIPDEEEEMFEASDYVDGEREEEKIYAEMLWSQVASSEN
ncbi:uncharacterized protein LOC109726127 [Ananas comosus]|uniref:Uncharacterized protein LOC109726127 n=1 Tax=Ananas comosus TaxID=4615 RepID=A0A6P5GR59_ANACO|nr:uncharacterized protein LOC109726127 [Ananas comosus]